MTGLDFARYVFGPPYFGWLCRGFMMTLVIGTTSSLGAALVALLVLRCRQQPNRLLRAIGAGYVIVFRNLPLVPLLLFLTFGFPEIWRQIAGHALPRGLELYLLVLGLSLNTGAYVSEILRAGVEAVALQQIEAARTLGLVPSAIRRRVIRPQAIRIVAPALASRFIHNLKNSTLAVIVPLPVERMELVGQAGRIAGQTFAWAEPLIFGACVYLVLAYGLGRLLNYWADREHAKILAS